MSTHVHTAACEAEELAAKFRAYATCEWFLNCTNPVAVMVPHPVIGSVPACAKCARFVEAAR